MYSFIYNTIQICLDTILANIETTCSLHLQGTMTMFVPISLADPGNERCHKSRRT